MLTSNCLMVYNFSADAGFPVFDKPRERVNMNLGEETRPAEGFAKLFAGLLQDPESFSRKVQPPKIDSAERLPDVPVH